MTDTNDVLAVQIGLRYALPHAARQMLRQTAQRMLMSHLKHTFRGRGEAGAHGAGLASGRPSADLATARASCGFQKEPPLRPRELNS